MNDSARSCGLSKFCSLVYYYGDIANDSTTNISLSFSPLFSPLVIRLALMFTSHSLTQFEISKYVFFLTCRGEGNPSISRPDAFVLYFAKYQFKTCLCLYVCNVSISMRWHVVVIVVVWTLKPSNPILAFFFLYV